MNVSQTQLSTQFLNKTLANRLKFKFQPIIPGKLYLGSKVAAADKKLLKEHKISHILNVTKTVRNHFKRDFTYKKIPVKNGDPKIADYFDEAYQFIDEGQRVFVHCKRGVSRSSSLVIAYIMKSHSLNYQDAYDFVRKAKPNIHPHKVIVRELKKIEHS